MNEHAHKQKYTHTCNDSHCAIQKVIVEQRRVYLIVSYIKRGLYIRSHIWHAHTQFLYIFLDQLNAQIVVCYSAAPPIRDIFNINYVIICCQI